MSQQSEVRVLVADLIFIDGKGLDPMTVVQGHIIGSCVKELSAKLNEWVALKRRQLLETQGELLHFHVRGVDLDHLSDGQIPATAEDIEKALEDAKPVLALPAIPQAPLDPFLLSIDPEISELFAKIKRVANWRRN